MSLLLLFNQSEASPVVVTEDRTLFGYINAVDEASLLAGSEASSMRAYNLADPILQRRWRSLETTSYFEAIFSETTSVDFLALAGCTLGKFDSVTHRLYDESGVLALEVTVDANVADGYGIHFLQLAETVSAARWRCDIIASSRETEGYFDIGRAWAGPAFFPSNGISPGYSNGWLDSADPGIAKYSGVSFTGPGAQRRAIEFSLDYMTEDDADAATDMMLACGVRKQVFFIPFTGGKWPRQAILGKFINPQLITEPVVTFPATYSQHFRIEQDL